MSLNDIQGGYLKFLSNEQIKLLHQASLEILDRTGVIIDNEKLQKIFAGRGGTVEKRRNIVRIPPEVVEEAIKSAPKELTLYDREGENELILKDNIVHTHTTGGPPNILDFESGQRRSAIRKDIENAAKLVDALDNIHSYLPLVSPTDVDAKAIEVEMVDAAIRNTTKVTGNPVMSKDDVKFIYEMVVAISGDEEKFKEKPFFVVSVSPISPLTFDKKLSEALIAAAEHNMPTTILPCPTTGGTAPVTFAGALAQQNAELLAGLTILQVIRSGVPVILGPRLTVMDMRTSLQAWGNTEVGMAATCAIQIIHDYGLPSDTYGLCSDAKIMDQQCGYEKAMNAMLPALAGANFISGSGCLESLNGTSLEQLVIDNEILGMIFKTLKSFEVNDDTLATEIINNVGPKGDFLRQNHTVKYLRLGEQYFPQISDRSSWEEWVKKGKKDIVNVAKEEIQTILDTHEIKPLKKHVRKELDKILDRARRYYDKNV